jgi:hypothetical protein
MYFFKVYETIGSRVSCFHWATTQYFGGLKMRFLKRPETVGITLRIHLWAHIRQFRGLKMRFLASRDPSATGTWVLKSHFSNYFTWKNDNLSVTKPYIHSYLASTKPLFGILAAWKWDYSTVIRTLVEEYRISGELLFIILKAWKSDSCRVMKSFTPGLLASCRALPRRRKHVT